MSYGSGLPRGIPRLTWQYSRQVEKVVVRYGSPPSVVVDLGAGGRRLAPHVHTVDFAALPGTDIIADVCATPFDDRTVDLVIATGLLEHVLDERKLLDECRRILKPGGVLHVELPFLQQYHDDPIDCRRYTVPGLARLLEQHGFQVSESGHHIGPTVTMMTLSAYYMALVFDGPTPLQKLASNLAFVMVHVVGWPLKFLDRWLARKPNAHRLAFGVYCTAYSGTVASGSIGPGYPT